MINKKFEVRQKDYQICLYTSSRPSDYSIINSNPEFREQRNQKKKISVVSACNKQSFQNQLQPNNRKFDKKSPQLNSFLKVIIKQNAEKSNSPRIKKQKSQCPNDKIIKNYQSRQEINLFKPKKININEVLISTNAKTCMQNKNQTKQLNLFNEFYPFPLQNDKASKQTKCKTQFSDVTQNNMIKSTENFNFFETEPFVLQKRKWSPHAKKRSHAQLHKKNNSFKNIQKQILPCQFKKQLTLINSSNSLAQSCQFPRPYIDLSKIKKYSDNQKNFCETPSPKRTKKQKQIKDPYYKPQFLRKIQQKNKQINSESFQSEVLLQKRELRLKVLSSSQHTKTLVLYVIKNLAINDTTCTYLVLQKQSKSIYCLKKCSTKVNPAQLQLLIREGKAGIMLNHPLLLKTYCTLYDDRNIYQLMEYMEGRTLYELSHAERNSIIKNNTLMTVNHEQSPQKNSSMSPCKINLADKINKQTSTIERNCKLQSIQLILRCVLNGLAYMHSEKVIHRDIKPSNIFISYDYTMKIGDFGSCGFENSKQYVGTLDYVAPQILLKKPYNQSVDMWSVGCLAYQLYVGKPPFYDKDNEVTIKNIVQCSYDKFKIGDKSLLCFVFALLQKNSAKRMTALQALQHPFIKNALCNSQIIN